MDDLCLLKRIFDGELATGKCTTGGQYTRYKDTLKTSLNNFDINIDTWKIIATIGGTCCKENRRGTIYYKKIINRLKNAKEWRARWENKIITETNMANFVC